MRDREKHVEIIKNLPKMSSGLLMANGWYNSQIPAVLIITWRVQPLFGWLYVLLDAVYAAA
jgi:hypothetical protein